MNYIYHITLNTAHSRVSPRDEVQQDVIDLLAATILSAHKMRGQIIEIEDTGYGILIEADAPQSKCLTLTITYEKKAIIRQLIAINNRCGYTALEQLTKFAESKNIGVRYNDKPNAPWCAALILDNSMLHAMPAAADLERCLAWAWIQLNE